MSYIKIDNVIINLGQVKYLFLKDDDKYLSEGLNPDYDPKIIHMGMECYNPYCKCKQEITVALPSKSIHLVLNRDIKICDKGDLVIFQEKHRKEYTYVLEYFTPLEF